MLFVLAFIFFAFLVAIAIATCVSLALWLVFGRTNLFFRMPLFLATLTLPGVFFALIEAGEALFVILFLASAIMIGAIMNCRPLAGKVVIGVFLAFIALTAFHQLPFVNWGRLEPVLGTWIARVFFATSLMAILFSTMRLIGFDVVRLLDGINDLELERRTGNSLDHWIGRLKNAKAETWSRAKLAGFLAEYGLDFSSQKDISMAFEKTLGRRTVGTSLSGNAQVIAQSSDATDERPWYQKRTFEQIGIAQLLMLTFCAACLFRFTSLVYQNLTTLTDFLIIGPLPLLVAFTVMGMLIHFLSVGQGYGKMLGSVCAVFVLLCIALHFIERRFLGSFGIAIWFISFTFPSALALYALMVQARHRGYRLVKVQQQKEAAPVDSLPETVL